MARPVNHGMHAHL